MRRPPYLPHQHAHGPGAVQIAHAGHVVVRGPADELLELQASVWRLLEASPARDGVLRWMLRDFGTDRVAALTPHQLRRAIAYCEAVERRHAWEMRRR